MPINELRFTSKLLEKPARRGLVVETTLRHFASVTYWVDPLDLKKHIHPRFEPVCVVVNGLAPRSMVSVVTFLNEDFRFAVFPWINTTFGQTNYRAYVEDSETGEQAVWFFGTCLDSLAVTIPRHLWRLPWHRARMNFDCFYDETAARYSRYDVKTRSDWSPGRLVIQDSGMAPSQLRGFENIEAALVLLTHPQSGYFFRRDRALSSCAIWHDRMRPTEGRLDEAQYPLLEKLGLVRQGDLTNIQSVLLQRDVDFTIYLPPRRVDV